MANIDEIRATNRAAVVNTAKIAKKQEIRELLEKKCTEQGVMTSLGFRMKCTWEDGNIVLQGALLLERQGESYMTLKDINGELHTDITIETAKQVADEMGLGYMAYWQQREAKYAQIAAATTLAEVEAITW